MAIHTLTTLDNITIELVDDEPHLLKIYSHAHAQKKDSDGTSRYDNDGQSPVLTVKISDNTYDKELFEANGVALLAPLDADEPETIIAWVNTEPDNEPAGYYMFAMYAEYSTWAIKMDVLRIEEDDDITIDKFLKWSVSDIREFLGLL